MKNRPFFALIFSYFLPGAGFFYARNLSWGLFYFSLFSIFCFVDYRLVTSLTEVSNASPWLLSISATVLVAIAATLHSYVYARRQKGPRIFFPVVILVLIFQVFFNSGITRVRRDFIDSFIVPSQEMKSTLEEKGRLFYLKNFNREDLKVGQLVVYEYQDKNEKKILLMKRVVEKAQNQIWIAYDDEKFPDKVLVSQELVVGLPKVIWYSKNYKKIGEDLQKTLP